MPFPAPFLCRESRTSSHQSFWGSKRLPALILTWTSPPPPLLWARCFFPWWGVDSATPKPRLCRHGGPCLECWPRGDTARLLIVGSALCGFKSQLSLLLSSPGQISPCAVEVRRCSRLAPHLLEASLLDNLSHARKIEVWDKRPLIRSATFPCGDATLACCLPAP